MQTDPGELKNQYAPWDASVQKFRKMLADLRSRMPRQAPSESTVGTGTLDELKALGYLGPADAGSATNVPEPSLLPDPKDKIGQQNLLHSAMMAAEEGRIGEARSGLEKVLELDANSETALLQLGELELHAGNYEKAAEYLMRARTVRPNDATAAFYEGQALEKTGNLEGAREALEASLKSSPQGSADTRVLLGRVYLQLKNLKAAEDQFEAALLVEPQNLDARIGLARVQVSDGRFSDALGLLTEQSKSAEAFELRAQAYTGLGKKAEAERARRRAGELKAGARGRQPLER